MQVIGQDKTSLPASCSRAWKLKVPVSQGAEVPSIAGRAVGMGGVFEHEKIVRPGNGHDPLHIAASPAK